MNGKAQLFVFLLLMFFFSGAIAITGNNVFLLASTLITFIICIAKHRQVNYRLLFLIVLFFTAVTYISDIFFPLPTDLLVVIGTILRVVFALSAATLLGFKFYDYYFQFIYMMAIISIPMYLIQNFYPQLFTQMLLPLAKAMSTDLRYNFKIYSYIIHTFHVNSPLRNSGFMWEPGAFGMAIGIALYYGLSAFKFQWNKQMLVLLVAGLTTLSTTFYFSLACIFVFYLTNKFRNNFKKIILLSLASFVSVYFFNNLPFLKEKIEFNIEHYDYYTKGGHLEMMTDIGGQSGRLISFAANLKSFLQYPLGHGDNISYQVTNALGEIISGANGLGPFMVRYGIIGIIFLIISLNKTSLYFKKVFQARFPQIFILLVLIYLFSNPIYRNPFFFTLLFLPFVSHKEQPIQANTVNKQNQ